MLGERPRFRSSAGFHVNIIINDHCEVQHGDLHVSLLKVENVVVEVIDMLVLKKTMIAT